MLLGRDIACDRVDRTLAAARAGDSAALVVSGEPGIGKSALLAHARAQAEGMAVLQARGFESESELAFAALTELLGPVGGRLDALPDFQRAALASALALGPPVSGDPLTVCVGALNLVAAAADGAPLLAVVDDAHWLDRPTAEVLAFIAHHLHAEGVALLIGTRSGPGAFDCRGLDVLSLEGLAPDAAAELARASASIDSGVAQRMATLTGGNPLALIELAGSLSEPQRRGSVPLDEPVPASGWAQHVFGQRLELLGPDTRRALLIATAAGGDEMLVLARALAGEGLSAAALEPAETAGLVQLSPDRFGFRHPLVRSAVYHLAAPPDVRSAHAAVAAALVEPERSDQRAWHLASAAVEPDAAVAAAMEQAARSADRRGGFATAARAFARAAALAPDAAERARLLVDAAEAAERIGGVAAALEHLDAADRVGLADSQRARAELLRGRVEARTGSTVRAFDLMASAAGRLRHDDPAAAVLALVESVDSCIRSGRPGQALETALAATALAEQLPPGPPQLYSQVAVATAQVFLGDALEASRLILEATEAALGGGRMAHDLQLRAYLGLGLAFAEEWDRAGEVLSELIADCELRAPALVTYPLVSQGWLERGIGDWTAAVTDLEVAVQRSVEGGRANDECWGHSVLAWIRAAQGQQQLVELHVARQLELDRLLELPYQVMTTHAARGLLALGGGDAAAAVDELERALELKQQHGYCDATTQPVVTPDLVEALIRCDRRRQCEPLIEQFARSAQRPSALALLARCRALVSGDEEADELFEQAAALHRQARDRFGLARTQLLHGERVRRAGLRRRSRELLEAARDGFAELGAEPWRARAEQEDVRSARVLRGAAADRDELTPSEHQVASLAVRGLQNREIAQRLFMSPKTVEAHLTRIYRKLGVRTRVELVHRYQPEPAAS